MSNRIRVIPHGDLSLRAGSISTSLLAEAANKVNLRLRSALISSGSVHLDLYEIIDLRMLSGLIGEMFSVELSRLDGRLLKNPNIDGYPDLCDVSGPGKQEIITSYSLDRFIEYDDGGFEVKNTFGVKKANTYIEPRKSRLHNIQKKLVWKAHHRKTNHLIAVHSDYIEKIPQIIAGFYTDSLTESDWTVKQQPKTGSTMTSFCQTTPSAFEKLKSGLIFHLEGIDYANYIRG